MESRKERLKKSRLYVIADKKTCGQKDILNAAAQTIKSGADIIQFRDKASKREDALKCALRMRKLLQNTKALFIVNDRLDLAKITDADGLHLGQNDLPIKIARKILGKDKIIGISCHNLRQAVLAQKSGADYIGLGPVFKTATKPAYRPTGLTLIKKCLKIIKVPFFAIGDINQGNLNRILSAGARRIAVCRAILQAENIPQATKFFSHALRINTYGHKR